MGGQVDGGVLGAGGQGAEEDEDDKGHILIFQEKELGLDMSPMCDRDNPTVEKSQVKKI